MRNFHVFCFFFLYTLVFGQSSSSSLLKVQTFLSSLPIQGSSVSALAVNLSTNDTLFDISSNRRLTPASTLKLFTTGAALDVLGSQFHFTTRIGYQGSIVKGVLHGDLVVIGGGDPCLGSSYFSSTHPDSVFNRIFHSLKRNGINSMDGQIVVIDTFYRDVHPPSTRFYEDMANYYGAIPQSLSWCDNSFSISLKSDSFPNKTCTIVETVPKLSNVLIECYAKSSFLNKDSAYIYPVSNKLVIRGSIPLGRDRFVIKGVNPSPSRQFIFDLTIFLRSKGLFSNPYSGNDSVSSNGNFKLLFEINSPSLEDIIVVTNQKSVNLFADNLFFEMGKTLNHNSIWDGGSIFLSNYWHSYLGSEIFIEDGSGVSPRDLITAAQSVSLLKFMHSSSNFNLFFNSLAVAGVSGTLKGSFLSFNHKLHAKSGSMRGVLCYSGYYKNRRSELVAFAVMVNNFSCETKNVKEAIEKLLIE